MNSSFIHLHTHSHYSLLSGLPKLKDLVTAAKTDGMGALTLTDAGNLYGAVEFFIECTKADIKPIIGVDFYVAARTRHDKEAGLDNRSHRLVLLAKNDAGYRNLIKLVTTSHLEGFYYKPRVDHELLREHNNDLICILPHFSGEHTKTLTTDSLDGAATTVADYVSIYGTDNTFLEITHHPEMDGQLDRRTHIIELSKKTNVPLVAAHDIYYMDKDDKQVRDTLLSIQGSERRNISRGNEDFSFVTQEQMQKNFEDIPEALENSVKIAEQCTFHLELEQWKFPNYVIKDGKTPMEKLRAIVENGIEEKRLEDTPEFRKRVEFEMKTIEDKGYATYFLVVGDLLREAHERGILTTIRGSVAGSLVTYLAGITKINPLEYNLPFERFLNPDRPSAPDIDMDFADDRRDEIIQYARDKYGEDKVAQIGTFGTLMARAAVRDVARALGYDYGMGDRIAKLIPVGAQGFPMTIERAFGEEPELKELYDTDEDVQTIIDMAQKIEGNARHIGVHAAGVVISPDPLVEHVPIQQDPKGSGKLITQYNMHSVGEDGIGLLKFDFLGLTNLAVLADAIKRVQKLYNEKINIEDIPLDDEATFTMLAEGKTHGVFQMGGSAMTQFLKELQPNSIHDINAMIALYRPGPMKNIPQYIRRKHGDEMVEYYHPKMESFLDKSYGILVYQDDLMSVALEIAGYTWKTVDKFRKAIGKKIPEEMAKQHEIFVAGCQKESGMSESEAEALWNLFEPFQGYGFNKAHAASYGRVAYQTAYMKANYPHAYMAAVLSAESGDTDKVAITVAECASMGIEVLPPDINESLGDFTVAYDTNPRDAYGIRFGLSSIKNFGEGITEDLIKERKANGPYTSLENLLSRVSSKSLNKRALESLIKCGALDNLGERGGMLGNLDDLLVYSRQTGAVAESQDSLFGLMDDQSTVPQLTLHDAPAASPEEMLTWEKELLGLYITGHPLDAYQDKVDTYGTDIQTLKEDLPAGIQTIVLGVIENVRSIHTKSGDPMAFVLISDKSSTMEVVIFPKLYPECREIIEGGGCIAVKGTLNDRGGELSILADKIKVLT